MTRPTIISLGEVLWDLFPDDPRFGGAPANFAAHAAMLGGDVTMVSAVGDDARGHKAIRILEGFGIRTDLIQIHPGTQTGSVGVELDEGGKPTYTIHERSAWDRIASSSSLEDRIKNASAVYFGTLGQRCEPSRSTIQHALDCARAVGIPRILDVNLRAPFYNRALIRDSVEQASILKLSDDELVEVCGALDISPPDPTAGCLCRLREQAELDLVVMTSGTEGAHLVSNEGTISLPAHPTTVCDTVGAGDAFTAAFLIGLLHGNTHEAALASANKLASQVCSQPGAVPHREIEHVD